jgi:Tfp pilus assembly protein PilF
MTDRIKQLQKFIEEDPTDPFNHYALALEYSNIDQQKALSMFEKLVAASKNYLPAYYQLAKLYEIMGQKDNAKKTFGAGIAIAKSQSDMKTLRELNSALAELEDD